MSSSQQSELKQRWSWLDGQRHEIARSLYRLEREMPRVERQGLRNIAGWFKGKAGFEKAIKRADVLAVCFPFLNCDTASNASQQEVDRAVRAGYSTMGRSVSNNGRIARLFAFPLILATGMAALGVFFSIWIIPAFETMMTEFGMGLPRMSRVIFKLAWIARTYWPFFSGGLAGLFVLMFLLNVVTRGSRNNGESWLDEKCKSRRNKAACWSWHMAMLLKSGVDVSQAVEIANAAQKSNWIFRSIRKLFGVNRQISAESNESVPLPLILGFQMAQSTLAISNTNAKVDLFCETASYYWAESKAIGDWWSQLAVSALFWIFAFSVLLLVNALFSPLIGLISGMSGMPGGGASGGWFW